MTDMEATALARIESKLDRIGETVNRLAIAQAAHEARTHDQGRRIASVEAAIAIHAKDLDRIRESQAHGRGIVAAITAAAGVGGGGVGALLSHLFGNPPGGSP